MILQHPSLKYKKSFLEGIAEFREDGFFSERSIESINTKTFSDYLANAKAHEKGKNLPEGWIPYSTYWLIDEGEFIGEVLIRHKLNQHLRKIGGHIGYGIRPSKRRLGYGKEILKLALVKAKELGIEQVLMTCDKTNIASRKIIEGNGGILKTINEQGEGKPKKLLFWIKN